jgi:tRNA A-37 threonylcarbamoyl transferase component Bud32
MNERNTPGVAEAIAATMTAGSVASSAVVPSGAPPSGAQRYEVRREIGRGGMGRVVEARDRQFGRIVAVKEIHAQLAGGGEQRFLVEALITGNLEHPGIPTVYERGVAMDGAPFYSMRRVQGRTLAEAIDHAGSLAERLKLLPVVIRAAQAIAYAHDHGVIHRDIKPHNIIVGPYGETVVLDWGIAKVRGMASLASAAGDETVKQASSSIETAHGSVLGTPAYMAPEQAEGKIDLVDERSDVFALGALLYHLLAGRPPYQGGEVAVVLARAIASEWEPLAVAAPDAPPPLRAVCEKALAAQPADRYASATAMAAALEAVTADAVARPESGAVRWFAGVTSVAAVIMLLAVCVMMSTEISSLREQGWTAWAHLSLALFGCILSAIEWVTRGRYRLGPIALAFALGTLFLGLGGMSAAVGQVMRALSRPQILGDPSRYRAVLAQGLFEVSGLLSSTGTLSALQILLWGIARRRASSAQPRGGTGP